MTPLTPLRLATAALVFLASVAPLVAGDWHNSQTACSECHTQHNSEAGAPVAGNNPAGSNYVLRRATAEELCLSCHDGSGVGAPNVLSTNSSYVAAAGFFTAPVTTATHHLVKTPTAAPPNTSPTMVLTCTTCHDPHGNANFRNLRPNPNPTGGTLSGGVVVKQTVIANGTNPAAVYIRTNLIDKNNVSLFCEACHVLLDPVADHPDDKPMWGALKASYPNWECTNPTPGIFCSTPALRTRATSPSDDVIPSPDDRVSCQSCHRAHGTAQWKSLYFTDNVTVDSTCQQCHNQ